MKLEDRRRIGTRVAEARRDAELTQRELAEILGVTVRSVQNYEAGAVVPYKHLRHIEFLARKRHGWILDGGDDTHLASTIATLQLAMERHQELTQTHLREMRRNMTRLREQVRENAELRSRIAG